MTFRDMRGFDISGCLRPYAFGHTLTGVYIILFLLFVLPFVVIPYGAGAFDTPKILAAQSGIVLLAVFAVRNWKGSDWAAIRENPVFRIFITGLTVLITVQVASGHFQPGAVFGNTFRFQGVITVYLMYLWMVLSSRYPLSDNVAAPMAGLAVTGLAVSALLIRDPGTGRAAGVAGEPNMLAAVMLFLFPFIMTGRVLGKSVKTALILALIISVVWTYSLSGLMGLVAEWFVYISLTNRTFSRFPVPGIIAFGLVMMLALPFLSPAGRTRESRPDIWKAAFVAGTSSPLIGHGFGAVDPVIQTAAEKLHLPVRYLFVDSSRNILLDWWVQAGLAGTGLFLYLMYMVLRNISVRKLSESMAFTGLFICLLFNPAGICTPIMFWWSVGQLIFSDRRRKDVNRQTDIDGKIPNRVK